MIYRHSLLRPVWAFTLVLLGLALLVPTRPASAQAAPGLFGAQFAVTPATGTIKALVLGCYFSDTTLPSALMEATVGIKRMYGPVNETPTIPQYFDRVSNGKLQLQADVKDWYKLPHAVASYASGSDSQEGDCRQIAQQFGPENYGVIVMLFNADTDMHNHADGKYVALRPWGGHGGWINQASHIHEIGHVLGLPHSHTLEESDLNNPDHAYSNAFDAMSGFDDSSQSFFFWNDTGWCNGYTDGVDLKDADLKGTDPLVNWTAGKGRCVYRDTAGAKHVAVHYSAYNKLRLGWLTEGVNTHTFFGGQSSFTLQALGSHNYMQKQLIAVPIDTSRFYAVEYRMRSADYYEGGLPEDAVVVYQIDRSKLTTNLGDGTRVQLLHPGQSFVGENTISITFDGTDAPDFSRVTVRGPIPAPTIASISPNFGASTRNSNIGYLPATVKGTNFVPGSSAEWYAQHLDGQKVTGGGGYVDSSTMTVRIPDALLRAGQSGFISVVNYATMGVGQTQRSGVVPFFVSPSGAAPVDYASRTLDTDGTTSLSAEKFTVTANNGKGNVAAATLASNPGLNADFPSADRWYTAVLGEGSTFRSVDTRQCNINGGTGVRWWDGAKWAQVSPAPSLADNCLGFTATDTSVPSLNDLRRGALFAVSRDFKIGALTAPDQVNEGTDVTLSGTILSPSTDGMGIIVDWGDGRIDRGPLAPKQGDFKLTHKYLDNPKGQPVGKYRVTVTLTDSHGTVASTATRSITVANVAPVPDIRTDVTTEAPGNPITAYIHIADKGLAGLDGDSFTATIDWGDGKVENVPVDLPNAANAAKHIYSDLPGVGTVQVPITVTVKDDDGATGSATTKVTITFGVAPTKVMMCDDANYGGRCRTMREPELANVDSVGIFSDQWSSIYLEGPVVVSVYESINFQGRCETFRASDPWLGDNYIGNDKISSMRIGVACP